MSEVEVKRTKTKTNVKSEVIGNKTKTKVWFKVRVAEDKDEDDEACSSDTATRSDGATSAPF